MHHVNNPKLEALMTKVVEGKASDKYPELIQASRKKSLIALAALHFLNSAGNGKQPQANRNAFHRRLQAVLWQRIDKTQRDRVGDGVTFQIILQSLELLEKLGLISQDKHDYVVPAPQMMACNAYSARMRAIIAGKEPLAA